MGTVCVNRSGKTWNITESNAGGKVVGQIKPNEVFSWVGGFGGNFTGVDCQQVRFHGGGGWLVGATDSGGLTPITECGLYKIDMYGKTCTVFQTRRSTAYYDPKTGAKIGTIPPLYYLCTREGTSGQENPQLMYVDYWGKNDPNREDVFVDVGYLSYPDFSNINLIGKI